MPLTNPELWRDIEAYKVGSFGGTSRFSERLADENGWEIPYAEAVVYEYKRFIYVLCVSGEVLSPSPDVDKAWHLHLVHTQDYWRYFRAVVGRDIHHQPYDGKEGADTHRQNQIRMMELLAHEFDEPPRADIWALDRREAAPRPPVADEGKFIILPRAITVRAAGPLGFAVLGTLLWSHGVVAGATAFGLSFLGALCWLTLTSASAAQGPGGCGGACDGGGHGGCGGGDGGCGGGD